MKNSITILIALLFGTAAVFAQSNTPVAQKGSSTSQNIKQSSSSVEAGQVHHTPQPARNVTPGKRSVAASHEGQKVHSLGGHNVQVKNRPASTTKHSKKSKGTMTPQHDLLGSKSAGGQQATTAEKKTGSSNSVKATTPQPKSAELQKRAEERAKTGNNNSEGQVNQANAPKVQDVKPTQIAKEKSAESKKRTVQRTANTGANRTSGAAAATSPKKN